MTPARGEAVARRLGVVVLEGDERGLGARGDGPARLAARRSASGAASAAARAWTSGQPGPARTSWAATAAAASRRTRRERRSGGRRGAARRRGRRRVLEVQVGGADAAPGARARPERPTASRCRSARTATSGPSPRRRRSPAPDVEADRARRPARRRAGPGRRAPRAPRGARAPVIQLTCEQATSLVCGPDRVGEVGERRRRGRPRRGARAAWSAGPSRPGCSSGAVSTSSPGPSSSPAQDAHDAVARARWSARRRRGRRPSVAA